MSSPTLFPIKAKPRPCSWCSRDIPPAKIGRVRKYCCQGCRQRAYELRRLANALDLVSRENIDLIEARRVYKRDGWRCGLCRKKINPKLRYPHPMCASMDHIIPLSKGGTHTYSNIQCAHVVCNIRKNNGGSGEQLALM